jgi:predicted  nucleic acid-binding Zn-ribbon protein
MLIVPLVGELSPQETSIAITGLRPDHNYIIRLVAINTSHFQAASEAIRVQTKPASSQDYFQSPSPRENEHEQDISVPAIQPYKNLVETVPAITPPAMHREHSNSVSQSKRGGRRVSPVAPTESFDESNQSDRDGVSLRDLTEKLDRFRAEIDAVEQDLAKEEEEFESGHVALNELKNGSKQAVADKENASKSLKKQVADLASQNSAAQGRRIAAEKQLQQKMQERQKLRDDVEKWDREIAAMHADAKRLDVERTKYRDEASKEVARLREEHSEQCLTNKALEESLRQTRGKIDELKSEKDRLDSEEPEVAQGLSLTTHAEEAEWASKLFILQTNYQVAYQRLQQAREYGTQAQLTLDAWRQRRLSQPTMFASTPILDFVPARRHSQRRQRALSLRNDANPHAMNYDMASAAPYNGSISSISPPFLSASLFFNAKNGSMTLPVEQLTHGMSPSEVELLTAGAPTSPSVAGALLPAGLLGDEVDRFGNLEPSSSRSSPLNANILPGLGAPQTLEQAHHGPNSPVSPESRSPSVFASPRDSSTHLPYHFGGPDSLMESDRRSVRSTASSMRNAAGVNTTTRFANLFGFNRQRGKTFSDEGPTLGSLRSQESQSFPRETSDQSALGRRRGSHSGTWMDQMHSVLSRNSANTAPGNANPSAPRRRFINVFGSKQDPWQSQESKEQSSPPRPGSTDSSERPNTLPTPSVDTQTRFGWPVSGDFTTQRAMTTLGPDWTMAAPTLTSTNSWSRHPSRRPSIQNGATHYLMDGAFLEDPDYQPQRRSPKLAPIGTRPASQVSTGSAEKPKLNPAAPSFKIKTVFTREKKGDKADKARNKKEKEAAASLAEISTPDLAASSRDISSLSSLAVDGRKSMSTAGDTGSEPRDSLEHTNSRTPSECAPKETFMQKLTRKSSATMFNFPSFTKSSEKGSNRFAGKRSIVPDEETEEEGSTIRLERSLESEKGGIAGSLSPLMNGRDSREKDRTSTGFSFRGLTVRGRKGEKTPSLHESVASDEGEAEWTTI